VPTVPPDHPAYVARPEPAGLSHEDIWEGWTAQLLFQPLDAVTPGARAVLRSLLAIGFRTPCGRRVCHFHVVEGMADPE
jgi:hypothetical protein